MCAATKRDRRRTFDVFRSYFDFGAELDDAIRRDAEELRWSGRQAQEAGVEALAPLGHPRPPAGFNVRVSDKKRKMARIQLEPGDFRTTQFSRNVRGLCKPEMGLNLPKPAIEVAR